MSKVKYVLLVVFVLLIAVWGIMFGGNSPMLYVDVATFIIVPVFPWLIASFVHGFKEQGSYMREIFREDESDLDILKKALTFFDMVKNLTIASAILASLIGFIGIMADVRDLTQVGRNFGVLAITIFYTALYLLTVIEPMRGVIKKKLN